MERVLRCECGFETSGSEASVVAAAQAHAWEAHGMDLSAEVARSLVHPRGPEGEDKRSRKLRD